MSTPAEDIPDFSKPRTRVAFKIDNDIFEAPPAIPAMILMDYAKQFNEANTADEQDLEKQLKIMTDLLSLMLRPPSYERFIERLSSTDEPIELDQVQSSIEYLMGRYGMRPIQQPSSSPNGPASQADGMSLTGNTPETVSISEPSI